MSAAETSQMSAVETRQVSAVATGPCLVLIRVNVRPMAVDREFVYI